jgi:cell division protein FtsX
MTNVLFRFQDRSSEESQDQIRKQILELPGVRTVARISPEATKDALRRLWYADVSDDEAANDLLTHLRQNANIVSADLPAERGLLGSSEKAKQ